MDDKLVYAKWIESYNVEENIDRQHKTVIHLLNELYNAMQEKNDKTSSIFEEFVAYTRKHFHDEEEFMAKCNYPYLKEHKKIHKSIRKELLTSLKQFRKRMFDSYDLLHLLKSRLNDHILSENRKIRVHLDSLNRAEKH